MTDQLRQLAKPFPDALIHKNPGGQGRGSYVKHATIVQRLLQVVGPFDYEIVELIRGDTKDLTGVVVGCRARLSLEIDGRKVTVVEVGDCENPSNWPHDGARSKDAASDALKRCAARFGLGLHLWASDEFFLYDGLTVKAQPVTDETGAPVE